MTALDDLSLLRSYVCIVECGSISAGARRLKISQPTLSRNLRTLEERCGTPLLRRNTHHMSLTQVGQSLLDDARTLLAQAEAAEQRLRAEQTMLSGQLRVFATIDCGQAIVTRLVSSFLQMHPKVTAHLALTNRPLHVIQEGCDVGILPGQIADESVVARPAGSITLGLAAAPSLVKSQRPARNLADLQGWPWVSLGGRQFWDAREVKLFTRQQAEQTLHVSPVLVSEGVTSIREAVRAGLGVAVLPLWLIREDLAEERLVRVLPECRAKDLPMHVVHAATTVQPARVRAFVDFAASYLKKELGDG